MQWDKLEIMAWSLGQEGIINQLYDLMQKTILLTWLLLFSVSVFGQSTFLKNFQGGSLRSFLPLSNGGILGVGTQSQPQYPYPEDGLLVRFNHDGEVIWKRRYPALNAIYYAVENNNGYVVVGDSVRTGAHPQPYYSIVSKLASNGDVIWSKILGGEYDISTPERLIKVQNGYLISGRYSINQQPRSYFSRIDEEGTTVWSKSFVAFPYGIEATPSFITEGDTLYTCYTFNANGCFSRFDLNTGNLIGLSSFGGIYFDGFTTIKSTQDGNFILAGLTRSTTGSEESRPWVVKVNRTGQIIWSKTYNLLGTSLTCFMAAASDGGFVLSMNGDNVATQAYAILAKIDAFGNLLWAYDYSVGQYSGSREIDSTVDGGFLAGLLKVNNLGRFANGCCPTPITFQVENFMPPYKYPFIIAEDWESTSPFFMDGITDALSMVSDVCENSLASINQQILVCQGDSIQINGNFFQAPNTIRDTVQNLEGGCDTVRVYNLVQVPQPFRVETVSFCPGNSVEINGISYTQPDTISQFLPATTGCDTLLVTFLRLKNLPKKYETTTFCPGDTVFVNGTGYQFPGILPFPDTLPGAGIGCDTLLYHILAYPVQPSSVAIICPPDMVVSTAPATPLAVNYTMPTATTDCVCPDLNFSLVQGFPTGAAFPVGNTQVCYSASDICGDFNSCCFKVEVEEELACDVKETGCIQYELLGISVDSAQNKTFRVRVTNDCVSPLVYMAIQIPNGVEAISPVQNSPYISFNNREYSVRNPNQSPFRSVRFKAVNDGIVAGQSDVFEYTLPAQANPVFIKVTTRLSSGVFYEAMFNTFGCVIHANKIADRSTSHTIPSPRVRVFPNPSNGELFIDFSEWESGTAQVRVLNVQGREMMQKLLATDGESQPFSVPLFLPDGLYFLEIKAENGERQIIKIVLRR